MRLGTIRAAVKTTLALALGCALAPLALAQTAPATGTTTQPAAPPILSDPTGVEYFPAKPSAPTGTAQPSVPAVLSDPTGVEHFPAKPAASMPTDAKGPKNMPHGSASAKAKAPARAAVPVAPGATATTPAASVVVSVPPNLTTTPVAAAK